MKTIYRIVLLVLTIGLTSQVMPMDAEVVARTILDPTISEDRRAQLIRQHLGQAPELIRAMTRNLGTGAEEYRCIPHIWRVAISAGRQDETPVVRRLLAVALPVSGERLRDWQAVVLGGGLINGWSLEGKWPEKRLRELIGEDADLSERWKRALVSAHAMVDDTKVPTGTRYDALRMIALDSWENGGKHLLQYLTKDTHAELQMGAVSGLGDMDYPEAAKALVNCLNIVTPDNRRLAIEALFRTTTRKQALREQLERGTIPAEWLSEAQRNALKP